MKFGEVLINQPDLKICITQLPLTTRKLSHGFRGLHLNSLVWRKLRVNERDKFPDEIVDKQ